MTLHSTLLDGTLAYVLLAVFMLLLARLAYGPAE